MQRKLVRVVSDGETKLFLGKKRVDTLSLEPGQRVETMVRTEDMPDGSIRMRAVQIRSVPPKRAA